MPGQTDDILPMNPQLTHETMDEKHERRYKQYWAFLRDEPICCPWVGPTLHQEMAWMNEGRKRIGLSRYEVMYYRTRYANDPAYKAKHLQYSRFRHLLRGAKKGKTEKLKEMVGIDWEELVEYLNDNPHGLKVGDRGVHIDHITPISSFEDPEDPDCWHYTNLQLMPASMNIRKSNRMDWPLDWDLDS